MRLTTFTKASDLLDAVRPVLAEHEAEHHLVLGVAEALVASPPPDGEFLGVSVDDDHGLVMAAVATNRRPLLIACDRPRDDVAAAARLMWDAIDAASLSPSHVIGGVDQVPAIADGWAERTGRTARVSMHQRAYKLTSVEPLALASGSLRQATVADTSLVLDWVAAFEREALTAIRSPRAVVERRIAAGELFLWCDPDPRTMAGWARPTRHAVAVNGVYTPAAWRGRGYATACVATLSARMLARGFEFCVLYTDLGNPTSNAIYMRIGYRPVRDFLMYALG